MGKEDDSSKQKDTCASFLKKLVTMRLNEGTVKYFKELAIAAGIPYQTLINL
jgi:predicted DNA binding CopG/RHH family protein